MTVPFYFETPFLKSAMASAEAEANASGQFMYIYHTGRGYEVLSTEVGNPTIIVHPKAKPE